jgi:hypothetical protein
MRRLALLVVVVIGVAVLVVSGFLLGNRRGHSQARAAAAEACTLPDPSSLVRAPSQGQTSAKVTATVQPGATTEFVVGRGVTAGPRRIPLDLDAPLTVNSALAVQPRSFARADGVQIPGGTMRAWAVVDGERTAEVTVCVAGDALTAAPGRYQGAVLLSDPRLVASVIPVSFNAYPPRWKMFLVAAVLCWVGSVYIYMLRRPSLPEDLRGRAAGTSDNPSLLSPREFWLGYWKWSTRLLGILTIASGVLAASIAFNAQYLRTDRAWNSGEWFGFIGTVTSAFVAGATAGRLAQNVYQRQPEQDGR